MYLELQQANDRIKYLQNEVKNLSNGSFDKILGKSYKLEKAKQIAKQVSKHKVAYLFVEKVVQAKKFSQELFMSIVKKVDNLYLLTAVQYLLNYLKVSFLVMNQAHLRELIKKEKWEYLSLRRMEPYF